MIRLCWMNLQSCHQHWMLVCNSMLLCQHWRIAAVLLSSNFEGCSRRVHVTCQHTSACLGCAFSMHDSLIQHFAQPVACRQPLCCWVWRPCFGPMYMFD